MSLLIKAQWTRQGQSYDFRLCLPSNGITVVFGPSGAGKTTLLRQVAGLEDCVGEIAFKGQDWTHLPTWKRGVGFVFQETLLFDHLSITDNLRFGVKPGLPALVPEEALIEALDLADLLKKTVGTLSGGERQRLALGRALMARPSLLLLDEPFSALDEIRRQGLIDLIQRVGQTIPIVLVTHRLDDITRLCQHLVLIDAGRAIASGPVDTVLSDIDPLGVFKDVHGVFLNATLSQIDSAWQLACASFVGGSLWIPNPKRPITSPLRLHIAARDVSLALTHHPDSSIQNSVVGTVTNITPVGDQARVLVRVRAGEADLLANITARAAHQLALQVGSTVYAQVKSVALMG